MSIKKLIRDGYSRTSPAQALSKAPEHDMPELLHEKLLEEANEIGDAIDQYQDSVGRDARIAGRVALIDELGDALQVLQSIAEQHNINWLEVIGACFNKRQRLGAFSERYLLDVSYFHKHKEPS